MSTDATVILDWVREHCLTDRPDVTLTPQTPLLDEVGLDSLQIVNLFGFLEEHFKLPLDVEDLTPDNFETVGHVVALVQRAREGSSA